MKQLSRCTLVLAVLLVTACGGGGGGSSPSSTDPPPPTSYTVGGTASGLAASGLVLLDNGGNALSVAANATSFTFSTELTSGSAYTVTIQSQPTGETCSVTNATGTVTADVTSVSVNCSSTVSGGGSNVVPMTVGNGPLGGGNDTFNIPYVSVQVCSYPATKCVTIKNVLVDSGSTGFRVMASALTNAGLTLTDMSDPHLPNNTIYECLPFADGYAWGAVASAQLEVGGETASDIPIQVIDDANPQPTNIPGSCTSNGSSLDSVSAFDANGVIGVGVSLQDCGTGCAIDASNDIYYTCTSGGSCSPTALPTTDQIANPVALFATDNNGVILQLPAISANGAAGASGSLTFGIGTESNNAIGSANVITANDNGDFTTQFNGSNLTSSFIDSGSNGMYFNDSSDSSLKTCSSSFGADAADFYCPSSTLSFSAVNEGDNGVEITTAFQVADVGAIANNDFAIDDVAGPAATIKNFGPYFDWGLPFFYGRSVFIAIEGTTVGSNTGPLYAY
jgi:hypothetical protein